MRDEQHLVTGAEFREERAAIEEEDRRSALTEGSRASNTKAGSGSRAPVRPPDGPKRN